MSHITDVKLMPDSSNLRSAWYHAGMKQQLTSLIIYILRKVSVGSNDADRERLANTVTEASVAFALRMVAVAGSFGLSFALARLAGSEGVGIYYQAVAIVSILTAIAQLGFPDVVLRFGTHFADKEQWAQLRGLVSSTRFFSGILALIFSASLFFASGWIAQVLFQDRSLGIVLRLFSLGIVPVTLAALYSVYLRALDKIELSLVYMTFTPVTILVLMLVFVPSFGVQGAGIAYMLAQIGMFIIVLVLWRVNISGRPKARIPFDRANLFSTATPLLIVTIFNILTDRVNVVLLGIWLDDSSVGIFAVAYRLATLTNFVLMAVNVVLPPRFAVLHADGEHEKLARLMHSTTKGLIVIGAIICLPLVFAPRLLLGIFGAEFQAGQWLLIIMAVGQFVNVAAGLVGRLLVMTGHEKAVRNNVIAYSVLYITLNILLIPTMGTLGAAFAVTIAITFKNLVAVYLVRRYLGIRL